MKITQSVKFPTWISTNRKSFLLDLVMTHFPTNVSCPYSAPIGSSDHMLVIVHISGYILRELPQCQQLVWHFTQANWQGLQAAISHQELSLVSTVLILIQSENSSTETCSLLCTDSSHLGFSYLPLLPTHGTLNPVMRQLL